MEDAFDVLAGEERDADLGHAGGHARPAALLQRAPRRGDGAQRACARDRGVARAPGGALSRLEHEGPHPARRAAGHKRPSADAARAGGGAGPRSLRAPRSAPTETSRRFVSHPGPQARGSGTDASEDRELARRVGDRESEAGWRRTWRPRHSAWRSANGTRCSLARSIGERRAVADLGTISLHDRRLRPHEASWRRQAPAGGGRARRRPAGGAGASSASSRWRRTCSWPKETRERRCRGREVALDGRTSPVGSRQVADGYVAALEAAFRAGRRGEGGRAAGHRRAACRRAS